MATIDFLPFANDAAANVVTQAAWVTAASGSYVQYGFSAGLAASNQVNKALRQSSVMSAALANAVSATLNQNVSDSGGAASVTALQAQLISFIQTASVSGAPTFQPQGRLTPTTGTPAIAADVISTGVLYYTPTYGSALPVWNGTAWQNLPVTADLTLTLTASATANGIIDVFALNNGLNAAAIAFGPVWGTATPGSGARGVGAGTTQLSRLSGLQTNAVVITLRNGATTYANVPINQATYLGSVWIDAVAGQTTCHVSYGQSRKFGVWNMYNRLPLVLQGGDGTASWAYATNIWRASNGNAANNVSVFTGLAEESADLRFMQINTTTGNLPVLGIGINSTTAPSGFQGQSQTAASSSFLANLAATFNTPALGINTFQCLEKVANSASTTFSGTNASMLIDASYRG